MRTRRETCGKITVYALGKAVLRFLFFCQSCIVPHRVQTPVLLQPMWLRRWADGILWLQHEEVHTHRERTMQGDNPRTTLFRRNSRGSEPVALLCFLLRPLY
ncbi:unnamed protein product [Ectocarpus sp. 12 AP-2014]